MVRGGQKSSFIIKVIGFGHGELHIHSDKAVGPAFKD